MLTASEEANTRPVFFGLPAAAAGFWIVAAALAATMLLLVVAVWPAWSTSRAPFLGLFTEPTLVVNGTGDQTWAGYAAGLRYTDQLTALDDQPLSDTTSLMRVLSQYQPGDVIAVAARGSDGTRPAAQAT